MLVPPPMFALPPEPEPSRITATTTESANTPHMNFLVAPRDRCRRLTRFRSRRPEVGRPLGGVVAGIRCTVGQGAASMWNRGNRR